MGIDHPVATDRSAESEPFVALVRPHLPVLHRYAARLVPVSDADDVLQESLTRAWRRFPTYDAGRGPVLPWLMAIVADQARRHRTRSRRSVELVEVPAQEAGHDLDLERAVDQLTGRQRQAVDLYYFVDLDVATIARVMGCSEGTVKATLHQARGALRRALGEDHE